MLATTVSSDRSASSAPLPPELALVEGLRDALVLLRDDWRITFLNARARRAMESVGLVAAEVIGQTIWEVFPFLDQSAEAELARARESSAPVHFNVHDTERDRWFEFDVMVAGELLAVYWRDVTAGRRAEELRVATEAEMHATHRRLEELVAGAPLAIIVLDNDLNVLMWNAAAEEMFQWSAAELLGRPLPTIPPEEHDAL